MSGALQAPTVHTLPCSVPTQAHMSDNSDEQQRPTARAPSEHNKSSMHNAKRCDAMDARHKNQTNTPPQEIVKTKTAIISRTAGQITTFHTPLHSQSKFRPKTRQIGRI